MAGVIRVAVVDDHPVARYGLERMLDAAGDLAVVASGDGPAAVPAQVDVVVLDLYLNSDTPSLPAVKALSGRCAVLVMSASRSPGDVLAALQHGASGFITKHSGDDAVLAAVRAVAAGGFHLSAQLADILQAELAVLAGPAAKPAPALSPREQEVLSLIARGFTHGQTATRLGVSPSTVETYVARIRAKLGLGNKAQLALAALEQQLGQHRPGPV
jgi:two-component system, NarL family, nitrate/nitrite response regulator NarL